MSNRPVRVSLFGKTDVGRTRDHNEDTFLVADLTRGEASLLPAVRDHEIGPRGTLLMVADGMGGAAAGEVASRMAADAVHAHLSSAWAADPDGSPDRFAFHLRQAVELANAGIHEFARNHSELRGMGTTATVAAILGADLYLAQIGDSRAYLVRRGTATQISRDQSLLQRLIEAGELTEEEAEQSDRRNIILQALGPDARVRVDLTWQPLCRDDLLILCSDGLSNQVRREEFASLAAEASDLAQFCGRLIELANERGGPDNITVVAARFTGTGLADPTDGEPVGRQVYPLSDSETTTEPVPIYTGSPPPRAVAVSDGPDLRLWVARGLLVLAGAVLALLLLRRR